MFDEEVEYRGKARAPEKYMSIDLDEIYELLPTITYLKFTGGEPMLIKAHWDLLEYAVKHDYAKNITLNYSTNATVYPKPRIVDTWASFETVEVALSLDSINKEENEYLGMEQSKIMY
jgi:molybdenum cofactor biosynthesis enzyme MoaA